MEHITADDLEDLALGSVFLATGGGGDPHIPLLITQRALEKFGPVSIIAPDALNDDDLVVTIGGVGAPTVSLELLPSLSEAPDTLDAFIEHIGRPVDAIASFEIGGANSLIPLIAAAQRGIPVIDGDGMGRALPEAQMMSYAIAGVKPTPAVACDYAGNHCTFSTESTEVYERHIRSFAMAAGGMITTAEHPMTGAELKRSVIPQTLSFSKRLGATLRSHKGHVDDLIAPLREIFDNSIYGEFRQIFQGKVVDKSTRIVGGYDVGEVTVERFSGASNTLRIDIKNEYLLATIADQVVASVPDLIVVVDIETGTPINAERLRYGHRVAVFAIGCPDFYRSDAALAVVSPSNFGFSTQYHALEDLPDLWGEDERAA